MAHKIVSIIFHWNYISVAGDNDRIFLSSRQDFISELKSFKYFKILTSMCTQFQMDWYLENCLTPKIEENEAVLELVVCDILKNIVSNRKRDRKRGHCLDSKPLFWGKEGKVGKVYWGILLLKRVIAMKTMLTIYFT